MTELDELRRAYLQRVLRDAEESPAGIGLESSLGLRRGDALLKARQGAALSASERVVLEAVVLPRARPVIDVANDSFQPPGGRWRDLEHSRAHLEAAIRAVGRVDLKGVTGIDYAGTGFLVGRDLLLTNRHVAEEFIHGEGTASLRFIPHRSASVDLRQEVTPGPAIVLQVREAILVHPYWDAALLRVSGFPADREPLALLGTAPGSIAGRPVAVIGYPAMDGNTALDVQLEVFRRVFERKRLQPGELMDLRAVQSYGGSVRALAHDCSTLGGNSGSAVIDLETGAVIALHFAGQYLVANYAVPAWELSLDQKVRDAGTRIMRPPAAGLPAPDWLSAWGSSSAPEAATSTVPSPGPALPLPPLDWYERMDDDALRTSLARDLDGTRRQLDQAVGREEAAEIEALLGGPAAEALFAPRVDPDLPEILYLHGIMGAHLDGPSRRVWLSALAMLTGDVAARLQLSSDGVTDIRPGALRPGPHLKLKYERAARRWRAQRFAVHPFSFDWRKGIAAAADQLHHFIEALALERPSRRFILVAHSMGGLVAATYANRHATWTDRIQRAVLAGSPLGGSYAPFEAVIGTYPFFGKLAAISPVNDLDDLMRTAATLPGLLDMLPDPRLFTDAEALYGADAWPRGPGAVVPSQRWLDQSRHLKPRLTASPLLERTTLLVALRHGTVSEARLDGGRFVPGPRTGAGDGTVPAPAAAIAGVPAFEVTHTHDDLMRDPATIRAVMDLATGGRCALPPVSPGRLRDTVPAAESPIVAEAGVEAGADSEDMASRLRRGVLWGPDVDWLLAPSWGPAPGLTARRDRSHG